MANSLLLDGALYGIDGNTHGVGKKRLVCTDFATGDILWKQGGFGCGSLTAADGKLIPPRLTARTGRKSTLPADESVEQIPKSYEENWHHVLEGMIHVVEGARGTAKRIRNDHYRIAGKTGTAQVITIKQTEEYDASKLSREKHDHALFVAFAPIEDPQIAVAVIVENGGHGGATAAPVARKVMDYYFGIPIEIETDAETEVAHAAADQQEGTDE